MNERDIVFQAGANNGLGVGGCLGAFMVGVFGIIPLALIAFTASAWREMPVILTIVWLVSFFPLAVLFVLSRVLRRYALIVGRTGWVEIVYPFKMVRLEPGDFSEVAVQSSHLGYQQGVPLRRTNVYFIRPGHVAATVAMQAFNQEQWRDFFAALRSVRPEVVVR